MKPILWALVGGAVAGILLLTRRAKGQEALPRSSSPPTPTPIPPSSGFDPNRTYGETIKYPLSVPAGWRRVTSTEVSALPELGTQANALRSSSGFTTMTYGKLTPFVASDSKTYATWIEQHYHEPGGSVRPWGLHHGVTLLART